MNIIIKIFTQLLYRKLMTNKYFVLCQDSLRTPLSYTVFQSFHANISETISLIETSQIEEIKGWFHSRRSIYLQYFSWKSSKEVTVQDNEKSTRADPFLNQFYYPSNLSEIVKVKPISSYSYFKKSLEETWATVHLILKPQNGRSDHMESKWNYRLQNH